MTSTNYEPPQNQDNSWMRWVFYIGLVLTLLAMLTFAGCSPRIYERIVTQRDTTYIVKHDSVTFYDRDSIFVKEKGDTIYKYVEKWRYRDRVRVDTILRARVDSVYVDRIKEVQVAKPLSWWESAKIGAFWWLLGALIVLLLYVFRKPLLKLIRIVI